MLLGTVVCQSRNSPLFHCRCYITSRNSPRGLFLQAIKIHSEEPPGAIATDHSHTVRIATGSLIVHVGDTLVDVDRAFGRVGGLTFSMTLEDRPALLRRIRHFGTAVGL